MDIALTIAGWLVIIMFTVFARYHLQMTYRMPTDLDRFRSWRYRRAIRKDVRRRQREQPLVIQDMRAPGEAFCAVCPDHEACLLGYPCSEVRRVNRRQA